jgi:alpha-glucosidase
VLDGVPGEHITVARRHGDEWFVGSITNGSRKVSISLDFLPEGVHTAEIYTDGDKSVPTRTKVRVEKSKVKSKDVLEFNLRESGGVAIRIYAGRR